MSDIDLGLYMITVDSPGRTHLDVAEAAIKGGATIIQYRDKTSSSRAMCETARRIRNLIDTINRKALFIVNDRIDIALASKADGVHLGQDDITIDIAREIMGKKYVIGVSATCLDEAVVAAGKGADYIGVGPIFPTPSKDDAAEPMGTNAFKQIRDTISIPIVAIGGISIDNCNDIVMAGADGIAVISAVAAAPDMITAVEELTAKINLSKRKMGKR